jgi:CBS-domain-containing membrane protein
MNIEQLMIRNVKTCTPDSTLDDAARIMWDQDCGAVPVVDEASRVVGMITDRDICMSAWIQGRPLVELRIANAMSARVYTCKPMDSIGSAEAIMQAQQVRRLPVVGADGRLVGILSLNDIALESARDSRTTNHWVTAREVAETLASVCKPHRTGEVALEPVSTAPANGRLKPRGRLATSR